MIDSKKKALIIFIKNPEIGKVKTRLAATVGNEQAMKIYLALLGHTRQIAQSLEVSRLLYYSSFVDKQDDWSESNFQKFVQKGEGLGVRMANAFKTVFEQHERVLIIGSDCASLTKEIVAEAYEQLNHSDFVIGPAKDGGYYLIGMNAFMPQVFEDIEWSTDSVFSRTIENINELGKSYYLLPVLSDIDVEEDWERYGWEV